ncbi:MOSC N-terminal beta barrel domain-containing protein [uncultured Piscinibacter sp.]|uniref:MOSC domain-containing protein n=1 Tax=uncultured Piscinibacter sp. TaxID=1131835 RepID=UPI0026225EF4|nr:MOSC N-terminal beta barrel domain-containing protein [uncultured Piscinibacter sp.]
MNETTGDIEVRIAGLNVHPIKSCAGIAMTEALVIETGLEFDRAWMVVDERGQFVSQRELPRMALVQPKLRQLDMVLRAPGMLALHVSLDTVESAVEATVWDDTVAAYDMGDLAAQWFSDFLGRKLRLVRFDPEQRRLSDRRWTGPIEAENAFSDGFPLLVASTEGLAELNRRLAQAGHAAVTMQRFRPNLVLDGLDAHGEDHLDEIVFAAPEGPVRLKLVKPCSRCTIPDVDPATGAQGHAVGDALAAYRADARLDGALTFGMNAVVLEGIEATLKVGMTGQATYRFE